uniref:Phosphatidic acid phosphatase type 2/haloperoxidase domain-containing protein n=1 Tax=Bicosoecida sp. CB-2014 TaxID=1486930 RepID=A0A6T6TZR1_9STRA|mmetsp:Transcript_11898/g.41718  ORF Transcript_11898/g.41718 Transcript_11898/m.41718 type:complete len:363 (+) Transcript_11898:144-1232(+)|eukprot:CAMPEP_0203833668 /NCGR_PEP_ID=MMETSP0115-20131106/72772_1 /ASSEMBLY_ACC=CAM_ASM_000227 /TAXON_ID=33651 /ORGANISM="Bicosoecid sp, Strain ms1" /LENGTH=362 /DNA_ID=CAMNT_0050742741 /DNA_START=588 /DNA_END=1676 /DNA_ORIENTATION=+
MCDCATAVAAICAVVFWVIAAVIELWVTPAATYKYDMLYDNYGHDPHGDTVPEWALAFAPIVALLIVGVWTCQHNGCVCDAQKGRNAGHHVLAMFLGVGAVVVVTQAMKEGITRPRPYFGLATNVQGMAEKHYCPDNATFYDEWVKANNNCDGDEGCGCELYPRCVVDDTFRRNGGNPDDDTSVVTSFKREGLFEPHLWDLDCSEPLRSASTNSKYWFFDAAGRPNYASLVSSPSGHTSISFAALGCFCVMMRFFREAQDAGHRLNEWHFWPAAIVAAIIFLVWAAYVGSTRDADNVHAWDDITWGALIGIVIGAVGACFAYCSGDTTQQGQGSAVSPASAVLPARPQGQGSSVEAQSQENT